ncbi:MAG: SWIM zinc finger family protein [Acidobacteriota bacterium]
MVGVDDSLNRLRAVLAACDDATLAALASKGLVRRARKDLERGAVTAVAPADGGDGVVGEVEGQRVTLPASGPADATCVCPATGCCRHVLALTLHLRTRGLPEDVSSGLAGELSEETPAVSSDLSSRSPQDSAEGLSEASSLDEILGALDPEQLRKHPGRRTLEAARRILAGEPDAAVSGSVPRVVRFPAAAVECRILPQPTPEALLRGVVTRTLAREKGSVPRSKERALGVAAVLAARRVLGLETELEPGVDALPAGPAVLPAARGAPRRRGDVIDAARAVLEELVGAGVVHASRAQSDRLTTLAVSAVGVHLPRLGHELRALADELGRLQARHAQADEERLVLSAARIHALLRALARAGDAPPSALVGRHRSRYLDAGRLELAAVCAWVWRTGSGYRGLTLLAWDLEAQVWRTWSESRPTGVDPRFSPRAAYQGESPWPRGSDLAADDCSPRALCGRRLVLDSARVNDQGRLSAHRASRLEAVGQLAPETLAASLEDAGQRITRWSRLASRAAALWPVGLARADETAPFVAVAGAAWGGHAFDEVRQQLVVELVDVDGATLPLELPWTTLFEGAVEHLEAATRDAPPWALVGRLLPRPRGPGLRPYTLLRRDVERGGTSFEVVNLTLDPPTPRRRWSGAWLRRLVGRFRPFALGASGEEERDDDGHDGGADLQALGAATDAAVSALEATLGHLAEAGRAALPRLRDELAAHVRRLEELVLPDLAAATERLTAATPSEVAARTLELRYLCMLLRQVAVRDVAVRENAVLESADE